MADNGGAVMARPTLGSRLRLWGQGHVLDARRSLMDLWAAPLGTFMTLLVLGIALALPAALQVLVRNGASVADSMESSARITLYLKDDLSEAAGKAFAQRLQQQGDAVSAGYRSAAENLAMFRARSGLGEALDELGSNPLPATVQVQPPEAARDPALAARLLGRLQSLPEVDSAELDLDWLQRLQTLLRLVGRVSAFLGLLLAAAVILIVSNTLRLRIENRRSEIEIIKLVGATDAFVRRPFLYDGVWLGLGGAVLAALLVKLLLLALAGPADALAQLYGALFRLSGLYPADYAALLGSGLVLGLMGALLAVNRHLRTLVPR